MPHPHTGDQSYIQWISYYKVADSCHQESHSIATVKHMQFVHIATSCSHVGKGCLDSQSEHNNTTDTVTYRTLVTEGNQVLGMING